MKKQLVVLIDEEVLEYFPDEQSVNEALHSLVAILHNANKEKL